MRNPTPLFLAAVLLFSGLVAFGEAAPEYGSATTTYSTAPTSAVSDSTAAVEAVTKPGITGACSEQDREDHIHDPNPEFIIQVRRCSRATWANHAKNIACLQTVYPTLSKQCTRCFAEMAKCSLDRCAFACAVNEESKGCVTCANSKCQPRLIACTGVARQDLP